MIDARCGHCGSVLAPTGRCPGDTPLLHHDGDEYGTAAQIAHRLGIDITAALVRRWAYRSRRPGRLSGQLPGHHLAGRGRGTTWYRYADAARVEMLTSTSTVGLKRGELTPVG
ncbi:hypothetical protein ACH5AJ_36560 [Streptomyces rochei]|uniref:hypothetical protein n=1 Tax=Streptomyces rochei TaxID=1928 RepID=UPI0037B095DE